MRCPQCRFDNPDTAAYCGRCQTLLGPACSNCGMVNPAVFDYCGRCGRRLSGRPVHESEDSTQTTTVAYAEQLEDEQRQVTVMFCDMQGSTPWTRRMGPEDAFTLMSAVLGILTTVVEDYAGTVAERRGDGILALFGIPRAIEDAPRRAVQAGLDIQGRIEAFNRAHRISGTPKEVRVRIGVNTGKVAVGRIAGDHRALPTAVGETVIMAARMEGLAAPGSIYVTHETCRLTRAYFLYNPLGYKTVKGVDRPIQVYCVDGLRTDRAYYEKCVYGLTDSEMVGRKQELESLELQVLRLMRGAGSVVNIIGEAGIGKSRLVAELKSRPVMHPTAVLEGRALSIGHKFSFHPIVNLLRQWAGIPDEADDGAAIGRLKQAVCGIAPEEGRQIWPFLALLMGLPVERFIVGIGSLQGEALESRIFKSARTLLENIARRRPLVLILEDLHWADDSTLGLLATLYRMAQSHPILFINVLRSGPDDARRRITDIARREGLAHFVEIALLPLDLASSQRLVARRLGRTGLHQALFRQIVGRAGGNPYFIEELLRAFIDARALIPAADGLQVTEKVYDIPIPVTINDLIMARIDRLDNEARRLVKLAAVLGERFPYWVLSAVVKNEAALTTPLAHLQRIRILNLLAVPDEIEIVFEHALIREVVYGSILPGRRRTLHLQVAEGIESALDDRRPEYAGMLAYHFSRANHQAKTEQYLIKAGRQALKASASSEAIHYYTEALARYTATFGERVDPDKVSRLEQQIAIALFNKGAYEEAGTHFERALSCLGQGIPRYRVTRLLRLAGDMAHLGIALYLPAVKFRRAISPDHENIVALHYKKCSTLALICPRRFFIESLHLVRQISRYDLKRFELGLKIFLGASALFSFTGLSFGLSRRILDAARACLPRDTPRMRLVFELMETAHNYLAGQWSDIRPLEPELTAAALDAGEIFEAWQYLYWHGLAAVHRGDVDRVWTVVDALQGIFRDYDNHFARLMAVELRTYLMMESGALEPALAEVEKGIGLARQADTPATLFELLSAKAWILIRLSDLTGAEESLAAAGECLAETDVVAEQRMLFDRSRLELIHAKLETESRHAGTADTAPLHREARRACRRLLASTRRCARHRPDAYRLAGVCCWLAERHGRALGWWRRAVTSATALGARFELARVYLEISRRLENSPGPPGRLDGLEARQYREMGRQLLAGSDVDGAGTGFPSCVQESSLVEVS